MKTIEISDGDYATLERAGESHFVVEGRAPMTPACVVSSLVRDLRKRMDPPDYQTTGFDRR